jgi:uncharacterized protein (TIGR03790 family)
VIGLLKSAASCLFIASMPVTCLGQGADKMTTPAAVHTAAEVLVISNANSSISMAIAGDYLEKRPGSKRLIVHCADSAIKTADETISIANYGAQIEAPVREFLRHHLEINFIVLTKGVPIRIHGTATGSRDVNVPGPLQASVDSYLAAVDYSEMKEAKKIGITGSGATGSVWLNRYWKAAVPFSHAAFGGYLVTRLDGYTGADAKALVSRSVAAESSSFHAGKVLLDVQPMLGMDDVESQPLDVAASIPDESNWSSWNADMVKASRMLKARKIAYELDFNDSFVGDRADLLGYFSWGSNDPAYTERDYQSLTFAPGSICDTAVSTSGRTFLPTTGGQSLIADLIAHGITGIKGYTDEPLLQAIASPSVLLDRYSSGFTMAESFYAASRFVGWTDVVIGDPLGHAPAGLRSSGAQLSGGAKR